MCIRDSINDGQLYVGSDGIGIGTTSPTHVFDFRVTEPSAYDVSDSTSWNAFRLGLTSDDTNTAVGILFSPEYAGDTPSENIGSGIVAVRDDSGVSRLVFITDPESGYPEERMVILDDGNVGIATSNPSFDFSVA